MLLKYRPAKIEDLPECLSKLRNRFAYTEREQRALMGLWQNLIRQGSVNFALVEDADSPHGDRILIFNFQVFVRKLEVNAVLEHGEPSVGHYFLRETARGKAPILNMTALQSANSSSGVDMVLMNYGSAAPFRETQAPARLSPRSLDWYLYAMGGYRLNSVLFELYDRWDWMWAEGLGCRLYRAPKSDPHGGADEREVDLASGPDARGVLMTAISPRPRLYGMLRPSDMRLLETLAGFAFGDMFPRFDFTAAQQQLLLHALFGATDEELAADLGIAKVSVKKRWAAIYEKVRDTAPDVLPAHLSEDNGSSRSAQKRRRLIGYIRHHMEELRPYEKRG
jgi:hypothetical protein